MDVVDKLKFLEESAEYTKWRASHADDYLVHFFVMMSTFSSVLDMTDIQIGYYDKATDAVTTFDISSSKVSLMPPQEAFKKGQHISALSFDKVKVSMSEGYGFALELQKKEHSADKPNKVILLLQEHKKIPIYNVTFITAAFNVLNIKVSAVNGSIVEAKKESLMAWRAPESD